MNEKAANRQREQNTKHQAAKKQQLKFNITTAKLSVTSKDFTVKMHKIKYLTDSWLSHLMHPSLPSENSVKTLQMHAHVYLCMKNVTF